MFFGAVNSLAQALLKFTVPGVPDTYQGCELWNFSLADPDNRRAIDFEVRKHLLGDCERLLSSSEQVEAACPRVGSATEMVGHDRSSEPKPLPLAALLENWWDGRVKLWVAMRTMHFRREHGSLFQLGSYAPVYGAGEKQEHLVAFAREHKNEAVIVAVPRLSYSLMRGRTAFPLGDAWGATVLAVPERFRDFVNVLTGEHWICASGHPLPCRDVFARFPVALLTAK